MSVLRLAACIAVAALVAFSQTPSHPSVAIFMEFDSSPGTAPLEVMKAEVAKLLRRSGVSLDWRMAAENHGTESFAGLVLLKFKGSCRAELAGPLENGFGSLGETHALGITKTAQGRVLPYSEVECDQVRQALSYLHRPAGRKERQRAMGIALGRVVAHELYHILARTTSHARHGLAKSTHSLEDLVAAQSLDFGEEDSRAIEDGVRLSPAQ